MPDFNETYLSNIIDITERNFQYTDSVKESIKDILTKWSENKQYLFHLFGDKEMVCSDLIELEKDDFDINKDYETFQENYRHYFIDWNDYIRFDSFVMNYVTVDGFKTNRVVRNYIVNDDIEIPAGTKFSKAMKYFLEDIHDKNRLQDYYSTFTQHFHSKKKGFIILSINPYDFLSISDNDNNWDSCHSTYEGDYRVGNYNYMGDEVTLVAYYISEDDNFNRKNDAFGNIMNWNSKIWRMLVHIKKVEDKVVIIYNRQYPSASQQFFDITDKMVLNLFNELKFSEIRPYNPIDRIAAIDYDNMAYNDLGRDGTFYKESTNIDRDLRYFMTIGEPVLCFECAEDFCSDSREGTCDCCSPRDTVCCEDCGMEWDPEEMYYDIDGRMICPDCLDKYYDYCDGCGEYFLKEEIHKHTDGKQYCSCCLGEVE